MEPIPMEATIRECYAPAMEITEQGAADACFERLVERGMAFGQTREEAESIQKQNLGYYAGYYDSETRRRVERLFQCAHPIFGSIEEKGEPTAEEAFEMGRNSV